MQNQSSSSRAAKNGQRPLSYATNLLTPKFAIEPTDFVGNRVTHIEYA